MAEITTRELLDRLATLEATVREQGAELARHRRRRRHGRSARRSLPLALAALLVALVPLATLAATPFTDLNPDSPHNGNIDAIYAAGITRGCDPGVAYCPNGNVTREEMASFLARTAGLGSNPPVANAKTAQTASNALALGGQPATFYQPADQAIASAQNAATVGGLAPSGLIRASRGKGSIITTANGQVVVATLAITAPGPGVALVTVAFRADAQSTSGACPCSGAVRLRHVQENAGGGIATAIAIASNTNAAADTDSASLSYAFPVGAGVNTFEVFGDRNGGTAPIIFYASGTVLFVPFGGTGGVGALGLDDPAPQDGTGEPQP
jgi:hypothetical protein